MADLPYYVDDPVMVEVRKAHRLLSEPDDRAETWQAYTGTCSAGDWSPRAAGPLDSSALMEEFDGHMRDLQEKAHA
ncbi:hypothetical protein AB0A05_27190 [Streptomyces sp. NPDC046374]|uniref:hypothetical protein n=1 Tax=Streptomyces sp. NPDC046374 TaxID=3154917 RepID=UPI0033F9D911